LLTVYYSGLSEFWKSWDETEAMIGTQKRGKLQKVLSAKESRGALLQLGLPCAMRAFQKVGRKINKSPFWTIRESVRKRIKIVQRQGGTAGRQIVKLPTPFIQKNEWGSNRAFRTEIKATKRTVQLKGKRYY